MASAGAVESTFESVGEQLRRRADDLGAALIEAAWLVALVTVPVYFNIYSSRSFEPDKVALLMVLAGMVAAAWLARVLAGGALWPPPDPSAARGRYRAGSVLVAAAAAFLLASAVATVLSLSPTRSWHGSFFRQQGLETLLCYVTIALAVVAHMRRAEQWRCAATAIMVGSIPVCAYAIVQGRWSRRDRAAGRHSSRLVVARQPDLPRLLPGDGLPGDHEPPARSPLGTAPDAVIGGGRRLAYGAMCGLQLTAMVLSQSRGPLLGLGAGLVVMGLAWSLRARAARPRATTAGARRPRRRLLVVAVGAGALVVFGLLAASGPQLGRLRRAADGRTDRNGLRPHHPDGSRQAADLAGRGRARDLRAAAARSGRRPGPTRRRSIPGRLRAGLLRPRLQQSFPRTARGRRVTPVDPRPRALRSPSTCS